MKKNMITTMLVVSLSFSSLTTIQAVTPSLVISDIDTHWANESIQTSIQKGYVDGYPDHTFKPDNNITKAEFVTMLTKAQSYVRKPLPDIKDWYSEFVGAVKEEGIYKETDFASSTWNDPLSRLEMARLAYRAADKKIKNAVVLQDDKAIMFHAVRIGLIQGVSGGELAKEGTTTRAQAVTIIERISKVLKGEALEVDKNALSYAEIEMTGSNFNTAFGMTLEEPLPRDLELNDDVTARIDQIVIMSYTDMDSPMRKHFPPLLETYRTPEEESDLVVMAVKITFKNPSYLTRPSQIFNPQRYLSLNGFSSVDYPSDIPTTDMYYTQIRSFNLSETPEVTTWMIGTKPRKEVDRWLSSPYTTRFIIDRVNSGESYIIASKN